MGREEPYAESEPSNRPRKQKTAASPSTSHKKKTCASPKSKRKQTTHTQGLIEREEGIGVSKDHSNITKPPPNKNQPELQKKISGINIRQKNKHSRDAKQKGGSPALAREKGARRKP